MLNPVPLSPHPALEQGELPVSGVSVAAVPGGLPRMSSRDLMGEAREIEIEHEGMVYRLRVTSLGKLILTK